MYPEAAQAPTWLEDRATRAAERRGRLVIVVIPPAKCVQIFNPKTAIGADEPAKDRGADGDERNPRCTRECIEVLSESPDAREVTPDRGDQSRFSGLTADYADGHGWIGLYP